MSVLYGSERVPQPHEAVCAVSNDLSTRTVTVRLSDLANNGYTRLLWKEAWRALRTWEESGSPRHPTIWASAPGAYQAAYAVTGNPEFGGSLRFTFPKGEQSYVQLISKPMAASAWIDKSTNRFINVVLKHRQG